MIKTVRTPGYNYNFNTETGYFERWGKTLDDDPQYSPIGLEILDLEISTICEQGCKHCYKNNKPIGKNMNFNTFKSIIDKIPTLTQVAFGIGDIKGNPDLFKIFEYCRGKSIVPNITINGNGLTDELAQKLVSLCGAISISHYSDSICFNAVKKLTDLGLKQVNIHQLLSEETYISTLMLLNSYETDERLSKLNAIVFLSLKKKGRGIDYHRLQDYHFRFIINDCIEKNIPFGFDSCSANKFLDAIKDNEYYDKIVQFIEPCESSNFSGYINVDGKFYPCSFAEESENEGCEGIDMNNVVDFLQDVWYNPHIINWRKNLINNCRNCPIYEI
jgi:radical SAM protein with 4Fe4S-binding SPASM domain